MTCKDLKVELPEWRGRLEIFVANIVKNGSAQVVAALLLPTNLERGREGEKDREIP